MKLILILLVVLATFAGGIKADEEDSIFVRTFNELHGEPPAAPPVSRANVQTLWIDQKLDNFDEAEERTWRMRYMSNDAFYVEGAPLFIFVGGEWTISSLSIRSGHFYDMAKEHNGYLFYTEHRYYGQSRPTDNLSADNIKYLNVLQALEDLAHFVRTMKSTIPGMANSKVILQGCSYSATMVTWFKKLYPELATGVWASSAPLFAKANFVEYKEVTGASIRLVGGEDCYNRIENGIAEMEDLFAKNRGAEVKGMLKLCSNFDESSDLDLWTLFSEISDIFAGVVQTHSGSTIQNACKSIMAGEDDISGVASYILSKFGRTNTCHDLSYKEIMKTIISSAYTSNIMRQWMYQTCNEYGWYQTSGSRAQPFGTKFPVLLYTTMCADAYGDQFSNEFINKQIDGTNAIFGGFTPDVENVYSTHGSLDPWSSMGIVKDQATIIPLHAHCKDMGSISASNTPEMRASKEKIAALVREWVSAPEAKNIANKFLAKLRKP